MHLEKARAFQGDMYQGHGLILRKFQTMMHHSGRLYVIKKFYNTSVDETEKFPHMVSYRNVTNNTLWTRPIRDIAGSFELETMH